MKYVPISAFILYLIMLFAIRKEIGEDLKRTGELVDIKRNKLYFILIFIANINLLVVDLVRPVPGYLNRNIMKYPGIFLYVYGILLTIYVVATIKDSMRGPNADKMKEFDGEDAYTINRNPLYKALMLITAGHLVTTTRLSFIFLKLSRFSGFFCLSKFTFLQNIAKVLIKNLRVKNYCKEIFS